ncbi:MAG: DNA gyrase inhibitor YacG [Geobacteraceae bacterium]|nr:DNA gyrase inhibitor YacG [Geobacteraceae bacterium]
MVVACPLCGKKNEWKGNPFRPFCSERCKMVDLGAWAGEEYRIPGDRADDEEGETIPDTRAVPPRPADPAA